MPPRKHSSSDLPASLICAQKQTTHPSSGDLFEFGVTVNTPQAQRDVQQAGKAHLVAVATCQRCALRQEVLHLACIVCGLRRNFALNSERSLWDTSLVCLQNGKPCQQHLPSSNCMRGCRRILCGASPILSALDLQPYEPARDHQHRQRLSSRKARLLESALSS